MQPHPDATVPAAESGPRAGRRVAVAIAAAAALYHLGAAGVTPFTALVHRPVHLALLGSLAVIGARRSTRRAAVGDALLLVLLLASCGYLILEHEALVLRAGQALPLDVALGAAALLAVLELTRRQVGWPLVGVALAALAYGLAGPYLPLLAHRGYEPARLLEHLYLTTEGIWGVPLGVSADYVFLFVLFGALLEAAGGGALLLALARRVAGRSRGGEAKTAALASALMGSLSGSAVANVVTTGPLTIPLMRRAGFSRHFAAAVEAAASTGGQIMPPVMGAGAFILATWTRIPYARVAAAAALPALLYYAALLFAIHFRAGRMGLQPTGRGNAEPIVSRLHLLLPLLVVVLLLAAGRSPMRAAFWGVIAAAVSSLPSQRTRLDRERTARALQAAGRGAVQVAAACAAAGVVVGVASLTGVGLRMSEFIVVASGGQLFPALALTALGSLVLGMGLPTTAAYVVLAALGAPALVTLGVPLLAAHLFVFYFGAISNVTPPVSLAAYAAAGVADAPLVPTALTAVGLSAAGFLVPFMFVYGPALLLDGTVAEVLLAAATATAGVAALSASIMGFAARPLGVGARLGLAAAALTLIFPGVATDLLGLALAGGALLLPSASVPGTEGAGPAHRPREAEETREP